MNCKTSPRILLFGTMGEIGPVVREDLEAAGINVLLVDFPQNTFRDEWGYRRGLGKAVEAFAPDVILPIGHQLAAARMKPELRPEMPVEIPEKIELLDSKVRCSRFVADLDIPQPRIFSRPEDSDPGNVIFKRDSSFGGCGVLRPKTLQGLRNLIEHEQGRPYLIQEFIPGKDVSVDCIRFGASFRASCYETVSKGQGQGPSTERRRVEFPLIAEMASTILDALDYNGLCGMDFRVDTGGNPLFLECNPRFCGGIRTQIESGFDIPMELLRMSGIII